ncbi:MAG TPA: Gfo/Idh/MocA family oxidoreductase [Candidatus Omnitrophica bacterium]|nr:Gfo/Idh/MocA family oxidoreductase [Candidatus Omnitrophota bacterium]
MIVGIIGVGNMGRHHARVYSELRGVSLVAVADVNEEQGRKIANEYNCNFYRDYREMFQKERIDAVSIALPTSLHKEITLYCVQNKKDVLIEKPIADSLEDGKEIVKEAEERGVIVMVGHIERFNPAVQKLKKMIDNGKFERITSIYTTRVGIFPPQIRDADVIIDLAVHDIDVCNFLLNKKVRKVYARAGRALHSKRADFATIFLEYDGTDVLMQVNWITPVKIRELTITGTKSYAELNYITQKLRVYENLYKKSFDSFGNFIIKFGEPNLKDIQIRTAEPLKLELEHFIQCVKERKKPLISDIEALYTLDIALKAIESYKNDKLVEVNPEESGFQN